MAEGVPRCSQVTHASLVTGTQPSPWSEPPHVLVPLLAWGEGQCSFLGTRRRLTAGRSLGGGPLPPPRPEPRGTEGNLDSPQEVGPALWASPARVGSEREQPLGPRQPDLVSCLPPATPTPPQHEAHASGDCPLVLGAPGAPQGPWHAAGAPSCRGERFCLCPCTNCAHPSHSHAGCMP